MPQKDRRNTLHVLRDALNDQTARAVLGRLSPEDLKALADHWSDPKRRSALTAPLEQPNATASAKAAPGAVGRIYGKLQPRHIKALSAMWQARGPNCT
jgi:hypothetical protein